MNPTRKYTVVIIGTGFAGSFALYKLLNNFKKNTKILVLEKGKNYSREENIKNRHLIRTQCDSSYINSTNKEWIFTPSLGGGSNCWWACTPRFHPSDFKMKTLYGIGEDWGLSYQDLEPYYCEAESVMNVSGEQTSYLPRTMPFPQPPHKFNAVDEILKARYGELFIHQPTARARLATNKRSACCATGECSICPANAKFTTVGDLSDIFQDPRVELITEATVTNIYHENNIAKKVFYKLNGKQYSANTELVVLGANAIFNPHILYKSDLRSNTQGKFLGEQLGVKIKYDLNNLANFQGSTSITGHGYMAYDGIHRKKHSGMLLEISNVPEIRLENNKWTHRLNCKLILEDILSANSTIDSTEEIPKVFFNGFSQYTLDAADFYTNEIDNILSSVPIEKKLQVEFEKTEGHIIGTTRMGSNESNSVTDKNCVHHKIRNIIILGSSVFPTSSLSNPSLTISALSLRAMDKL